MWQVYIIECSDNALYTGITNDLKRRFKEHQSGVTHYTSYNRPGKILYTESFPNKFEAAAREKQIKGWTRVKKLALIKGDLQLLKKL